MKKKSAHFAQINNIFAAINDITDLYNSFKRIFYGRFYKHEGLERRLRNEKNSSFKHIVKSNCYNQLNIQNDWEGQRQLLGYRYGYAQRHQ
jgi:hypothetical protein